MSDLRRALERAVTQGLCNRDSINEVDAVVDAVIQCLVTEPLMVVLSGLSEEVIASRAGGYKPSSNFRA